MRSVRRLGLINSALMILPFCSFGQKADDTAFAEHERVMVNHVRFDAFLSSRRGFFLVDRKGDTVIRQLGDFYTNMEFSDVNQDGYKDILLYISSNTAGECELFLFSPRTNRYNRIADMQEFPAPQKIPHTPYYFSYHHSGCADMDWNSDLFYIKHLTAIRIGNISVSDCGDPGDSVRISRVKGDAERVIEKLSVKAFHRLKGGKWEFIERYWTHNFKKFI